MVEEAGEMLSLQRTSSNAGTRCMEDGGNGARHSGCTRKGKESMGAKAVSSHDTPFLMLRRGKVEGNKGSYATPLTRTSDW